MDGLSDVLSRIRAVAYRYKTDREEHGHNDPTELTRPPPQLSERVGQHRLELLHLPVEALLLLQVKQSSPIVHRQLRHGREIASGPVDRRPRLQEPGVAAAVGGYVVYAHSEGEAVAGEDGDLRGDETILSQLIGCGGGTKGFINTTPLASS